MSDLKFLFSPHSVALVGASTRPESVGHFVFENLRLSSFKGKIFPVNPKASKLGGLKCYPALAAIKTKIDLVVIVIPAPAVPAILVEAGKLGIKAAVIISAGFKETGHHDLEEQIVKIAKRYGIAVLGPNCLGFIRPSLGLNTTFAKIMPAAGSLAFLSQSGALGTAILDNAQELQLGFSLFASVGNKAVLNEADFLRYLIMDSQTKVLGIYAEQLSEPQRLIPLIKRFTNGPKARPIVILKSGRTVSGAKASASHTGAIAGNDEIYQAFFRESGIIRAQDMAEFFDYLQIFSHNQALPARQVAIITNAGGPGVLAADAVNINNLVLSQLSATSREALSKLLPNAASTSNPVDLLGDADAKRYRSALNIVAADKAVQSLLILVTPQAMTDVEELARQIIIWRHSHQTKPLAVCLMGAALMTNAATSLRRAGIAVFSYPEAAVKALAALSLFVEQSTLKPALFIKPRINLDQAKKKVDKIFVHLREQGIKQIPDFEALPILRAYGLPVPKFLLVKSQGDAARARQYFSGPVALKIASFDILHKSDSNGILLDIPPAKIVGAYRRLLAQVKKKQPRALITGVLIMPMVKADLAELIIGSIKDTNLGQALMLGWGGIYTETIKDVAFALSPLTATKINEMINTLKVSSVLRGSRGQKSADFKAISRILFSLEALLFDFPEIKEIDLNPVAVSAAEISVLDARFIIV